MLSHTPDGPIYQIAHRNGSHWVNNSCSVQIAEWTNATDAPAPHKGVCFRSGRQNRGGKEEGKQKREREREREGERERETALAKENTQTWALLKFLYFLECHIIKIYIFEIMWEVQGCLLLQCSGYVIAMILRCHKIVRVHHKSCLQCTWGKGGWMQLNSDCLPCITVCVCVCVCVKRKVGGGCNRFAMSKNKHEWYKRDFQVLLAKL